MHVLRFPHINADGECAYMITYFGPRSEWMSWNSSIDVGKKLKKFSMRRTQNKFRLSSQNFEKWVVHVQTGPSQGQAPTQGKNQTLQTFPFINFALCISSFRIRLLTIFLSNFILPHSAIYQTKSKSNETNIWNLCKLCEQIIMFVYSNVICFIWLELAAAISDFQHIANQNSLPVGHVRQL